MNNFPDMIHFKLGIYVDAIVDWLVTNGEAVFAAITKGMLGFLLAIQGFLLWVPWYIIILVVFLLGMLVKKQLIF